MEIYINTLSKKDYSRIFYYISQNRLKKYKGKNNKSYILSEELEALDHQKRGKETQIVAIKIKHNSPLYLSYGLTRLADISFNIAQNLTYYMKNIIPNKYQFYIDEEGKLSIQYNRILKEYQEEAAK